MLVILLSGDDMEKTQAKEVVPGRKMQVVSLVIIILLIAETIVLILQNRNLKAEIVVMLTGDQTAPLQPGERVEPFTAKLLNGHAATVAYNDPSKQYLLFVFSTTCLHCEKNFPLWKSLAAHAPGQCEITGVSIHAVDKTFDYIERQEANFPSVSVSGDTSFARKYKITGVPQTLLITGGGVVKKNWVGELSPDQVKEIQVLIHGTSAPTN